MICRLMIIDRNQKEEGSKNMMLIRRLFYWTALKDVGKICYFEAYLFTTIGHVATIVVVVYIAYKMKAHLEFRAQPCSMFGWVLIMVICAQILYISNL